LYPPLFKMITPLQRSAHIYISSTLLPFIFVHSFIVPF
jgi:hypothetical protein